MINCVEFFSVEACVPDLQATTRDAALEELVGAAIKGGVLPKGRKDQAFEGLIAREERGSTGLGRGIAIPHAKIDGLRRHGGVIARSAEGVDFRAIDGEPVHAMVVLVSPENRAEEHLEMLRFISTIARDPDFASFIRQATTAEQIFEVLRERTS